MFAAVSLQHLTLHVLTSIERCEDTFLRALAIACERPMSAPLPRRGGDFSVDLLVVGVKRLQLDVLNVLEHSCLASLRQLVETIFLVDDALVDNVLDGARSSRYHCRLVLREQILVRRQPRLRRCRVLWLKSAQSARATTRIGLFDARKSLL